MWCTQSYCQIAIFFYCILNIQKAVRPEHRFDIVRYGYEFLYSKQIAFAKSDTQVSHFDSSCPMCRRPFAYPVWVFFISHIHTFAMAVYDALDVELNICAHCQTLQIHLIYFYYSEWFDVFMKKSHRYIRKGMTFTPNMWLKCYLRTEHMR